PIRVVIVGAGARGNRVFAELMATEDTGFRAVGVVEPHEGRREDFRRRYAVPIEHAFGSLEDFLAAPRFGDIVFICTPDVTHYAHARAVSEKGYDILLEKPIATTLPDCLALVDVQHTYKNQIFVAHVLRYSPFFRAVKEIVDSGRLGAIRNIELHENIGHWHFAHSYVRGNWGREATSGPIILTKSSHDLDILHWVVGERVEAVVSYGGLEFFREENAPPEAAERCVACPLQDTCTYSATRLYLNERDEWPFNVVAPPPDSPEARRREIETGPYGRCVWKCDNDVCDDQIVLLRFASGIEATLGLHALTDENTRTLRILFHGAELTGNLVRGELSIAHFTGRPGVQEVEEVPLPALGHHGGGDLRLLHLLHEHLTEGKHAGLVTSLESSLPSHALAFLAEQSRKEGSVQVPVPEVFSPRAIERMARARRAG
ncbi:MAG TPA: Gfo/Idh/MocA family oxidoreductase, partial [Longimicrobiales bacterium]|nr:Gfo/Idh/MocA family oxidoreductase [Longimicrobiales bacterium]